jgi:hypothetical protein
MSRVSYKFPGELINQWWPPLAAKGYRILIFDKDPEAIEVLKATMGPAMWEDDIVAGDRGGLVLSEHACVVVSIRRNPPRLPPRVPDGYFELHFAPTISRHWFRSTEEKKLLKDLKDVIDGLGLEML